jgi:carboxypeptidase C (cathepsin A)
VAFDGVILLSTALDVRTFMTAGPGNELPYVTNLPTFAATAYYHNALPEKPADFEMFLREARVFASGEYLAALFQGDSLPPERAAQIAAKLHHFTGLSVDYLKRTDLRIDSNRFLKELLRGRGQTIAIHDTRFLGKDPDDAGEGVQFDPFLFGIAGPFVATINSYLSGDLKVKMERAYHVFSLEASQSWKRAGSNNAAFDGFLYTAQYLAQAAATNKDFRIFVASGLHDLATAFYATEYIFDHSGIPKDKVTLKNYYGGHMMYMYAASSKQMAEDLRVFIQDK